MNRKRMAVTVGLIILLMVAVVVLWTENSTTPVAEETHAEGEEPHVEGDKLHGKGDEAHGDDETSGDLVVLRPEQIEASRIEIQTVGRGAAVELVFPATVATSPSSSARIDARASGVVLSLEKTLGDHVRKGETIARIESADAAALASQVNSARARVNELSAAYERERRLFEANVTARQDLESARANLEVAQSELARAQAAVAAAGVSDDGRSLSVTSPLSGRVTAAPIVLGSFVEAGEELYRIVDPSGMQVEVALPSTEAARIQPGDAAILNLPGKQEVGALVRSVTPSLDPASRSATAILSLRRAVPSLQPGAFLQARIRPSGEVDPNRISVAEDAVQTVEGREVVFVRTKQGFQTRAVVVGARSGGRVTIKSGLEPGVMIATENAFLLKSELEKESAEHGH
jgi:cobalt-zinc-cadmium efflux system membrane fusion protein